MQQKAAKESLSKRMNGKGQGLKQLTAQEHQTMIQDIMSMKKSKEEKMMAGLNSPDMQNPVKLAKGVQRAKDYAIGHYKRVM